MGGYVEMTDSNNQTVGCNPHPVIPARTVGSATDAWLQLLLGLQVRRTIFHTPMLGYYVGKTLAPRFREVCSMLFVLRPTPQNSSRTKPMMSHVDFDVLDESLPNKWKIRFSVFQQVVRGLVVGYVFRR